MKRGRSDHAAFNLEDEFYVVGGRLTVGDDSYEWIESCEVFDVEQGKILNF